MNKKTILTICKSAIIVLLLFAIVFALRVPAADLNLLPNEMKGDYVDSSGLPYFSEMDSYYNLRLTENYVDHGFVGDKIVNNTQMDMHRVAPDGLPVNYELGIVYLTSFLHQLANHFGSHSVKEVAFWTGAFVSCFAVFPVYIFARRLTNDYGAITSTLLIVLAPNYFAHTFPGFFDTDMFYYIFSVFFILFFMETLRTNNKLYKIIFAILAILSIGLFSISWTGYIFYVGIMGIFTVVYLILSYVFNIGKDNVEEYNNKFSWFIHQKDFLSIILLAVVAFTGLAIFKGIDGIFNIFSSLVGLLSLQSASTSIAGFPNVLVSVAEMQIPNLVGEGMGSAFLANSNGVVNGIGGISILFAGLIAIYSLFLGLRGLKSNKKQDDYKKPHKSERLSPSKRISQKNRFKLSFKDIAGFGSNNDMESTKHLTLLYSSLFIVWIIISALAVSRGSRFITTLVLPFGFLTGLFVGYSADYVKSKLNNDNWLVAIIFLTSFLAAFPLIQISFMHGIILLVAIITIGVLLIFGIKDTNISFRNVPLKKYIVVFAIVLALISPTICGAYQTSNNVVPGTSDAMWDAMVWINHNTPNNTVITSWWDFGYLFEIAADRQVTFDGGSQSGERAFWLGQAMTTDNLDLSVGIFRMLGTTGDKAVSTLNMYTNNDTGHTTDILIHILPLNSQDAKTKLVNTYKLSSSQADKVINYTHPENPRPVIFVASSDMLQKAGWWTYFGAWDFKNKSSINYQYHVPNQQITVKPNSVEKLSIFKDSGITFNVVIKRGADNNTTTAYTEAVSPNGSNIYINKTKFNPLSISRLIFVQDGYILKNQSIKGANNSNYTLLLMGEKDVYTPILMSNELENSMFTRLFLLGGANQNRFTMVHMENGVSLWQVNFNNTATGGGTTTNSTK